MPLFPNNDIDAVYISMFDLENPWSRFGLKSFLLDEQVWQTAEHYYQSMKFEDQDYKDKIRCAQTPELAKKLGKPWFKRKRKDWSKIQTTVMTRALYTQCKSYDEIAEALLDTGDKQIIENSQFDYFWGCGRDSRGHNHYGKVLMNIRTKLQDE